MIALAGAASLAVAFAAQAYASIVLENGVANWLRLFRLQLVRWFTWAALIPFIVFLQRRLPLRPGTLRKRLPIWALVALALCFTQGAVMLTIAHALGWLAPPKPPATPHLGYAIWVNFPANLASNLLYFVLFAAAIHLWNHYAETRERETREAWLEARLATAELDVLKMQLHPHFLFNTLNTVSSLMNHDVESARRVLASLGDLLRMSLEEMGAQEIPLREELLFLEHYMEIQQARFRDRMSFSVDVTDAARDGLVPSLLLQPLVENAIRHGIERRRESGRVWISATRNGERLRLEVRDNGPGAQGSSSIPHQGIGLRNTRARLKQLYGEEQRFEAGDVREGGFRVVIDIPYRGADQRSS
ncbi:MAG TPA: histidine kinase [Gemmatimonadaceae bacterium]